MECPICNIEMKLVPAGVSKKSGKEYSAFYSCPECKNTIDAGVAKKVVHTAAPAPKPATNGKDEYTEGKKENTRLMQRNSLMIEVFKKSPPGISMGVVKEVFNDLWSEVEK